VPFFLPFLRAPSNGPLQSALITVRDAALLIAPCAGAPIGVSLRHKQRHRHKYARDPLIVALVILEPKPAPLTCAPKNRERFPSFRLH